MRRSLLPIWLLSAPVFAQDAPPVPPPASLLQPRLDGRWLGLAAQDAPAALWWAGPAERDARGPATLADALAGAPGLLAGPAPGNGTASLIVDHGRAQPGLVLGRTALPGVAPLLPGLPDADLLLLAPAGGLGEAAGVVTLSLRRPGEKLAGMGEFAAGAFGSRRVLGRIDLPMGSGVRLGLGGQLQHDLGWLANSTTGERLNRGERAGLSATLDIDLTPALTLAVTSLYARSQAGNLPAFACDPAAPARCDGRFASTGQLANPPRPFTPRWGPISADLAEQSLGQRADLTLNDVRLAWAGTRVRLELGAGFAHQTGRQGLDLADGRQLATLETPAGLASGGYGLIAHTEEQRQGLDLVGTADLGLLTLTAGAGYSDAVSRRTAADTIAGTVIADRRLAQHDSRRTVFGQARLEPGGGLALEAGVRVLRQTLRLEVEDRRAGCDPCLANTGPAGRAATLITPEVALSWRLSPQWLVFARSARSARLPGWNLLARSRAELQLLPEESGWQHSVGVKADLWPSGNGPRLRFDASGFVATTRALVSPLFGIDPLALASNPRLDMRNHGIDVIAQARPLAQLELAASLGWQQARWRGAVPAGAPSRPLYAPDTTASLSAAWHQPLAGTGSVLVPRVAARWRSRMGVAAAPVPGLADGVAPGGWQLAAALQLEIPDGGWLMSLECENCLDRTLATGAVAGLATLNPPRWWQLRFTRRF